MAVCPFARKRLIAPGSSDPRINARAVVWHVAVTKTASLYEFFRFRSGGIESHFYINWRGKIEQYRDTRYQADANLGANDFAVSVETAGFGIGRWNPLQRRSMKRLSLWLHRAENIPLEKIRTATGSGHGYHVQFGAPGPWTPVAKSCPGNGRIKQFNRWFVPWLNSNHDAPEPAPAPTPTPEPEDDVNLDEPLNRHDPKGRLETRDITVREALTANVIHITKGRRAARRYLAKSRKSKA